MADGTQDMNVACGALQSLKTNNGSITAAFQQVSEGKATYSHHQHTKIESQYAWPIQSIAWYLKCDLQC